MSAPVWDSGFRLDGAGTWLLEASAGTGKTWQISSLVARLVVEAGVPIEEILVITFTRAATAELRDRIRSRLVVVRDALQARATGPHAPAVDGDPVLAALVGSDISEVPNDPDTTTRLMRARQALSAFDQAPISTIHGFCQRMLQTLPLESGEDVDLTLVEDIGELRAQVVADTLASTIAAADAEELAALDAAGWSEGTLDAIARAATAFPHAPIAPALPDASSQAALAEEALAWWRDAEGGRALLTAVRPGRGRPRLWTNGPASGATLDKWDAKVDAWLAGGGHVADIRLKSRGRNGLLGSPFPALLTPALDPAAATPEQVAQVRANFGRLARFIRALINAPSAPLVRFAHRVRDEVNGALRRAHQLSFDAILTRLADAVEAEADRGGPAPLTDAIRQQFQVAFVDEFQDTDPAQWQVMRRVFHASSAHRLLLIGDPKQAIYAFRGADVFVYLDAKGHTTPGDGEGSPGCYTMGTNYRSDAGLIDAMNALWGAADRPFGAEVGIDYVAVDPRPGAPRFALDGGERRPLELRWLTADGEAAIASKGPGRVAAAACCAAEVVSLLEGGHDLKAGDVAVLVNAHHEARAVQQALTRCGVQSVRAGRDSVFTGPAALWLMQALEALAEPGDDRRAATLASAPLFGWSLAEIEAARRVGAEDQPAPTLERAPDALDWMGFRERITEAAARWQKGRFTGAMSWLLLSGRAPTVDGGDVMRRLLTLDEGERHATDLRHLMELGHVAERQHHLGPAGVAEWLRRQRSQPGQQGADAESLRLESDRDAVQIVTIHKSKGLQYPVVLLPFMWAAKAPRGGRGQPLVVHPEGHALLDLHAEEDPARDAHKALQRQEQAEEQMRLLYVAMTRAEHHCVAWLGPVGRDAAGAALNRLVLAAEAAGCVAEGIDLDDPAALADELSERFAEGPVGFRVTAPPSELPRVADDAGDQGEAGPLRAAVRTRSAGTSWQRASFTSLARGTHGVKVEAPDLRGGEDEVQPLRGEAVGAEDRDSPRDGAGKDTSAEDARRAPSPAAPLAAPLPLSTMWGGATVGVWAHAVLEHIDFAGAGRLVPDAADIAGAIAAGTLSELASEVALVPRGDRHGPTAGSALGLAATLGVRHGHRRDHDHACFVAALPGILTTPLATDHVDARWRLGDTCLADLALSDRVDELAFDLRVAGGQRRLAGAAGSLRLDTHGAAAALERRLEADSAWDGRGWLRGLLAGGSESNQGPLPAIRGFLTGLIDLVFRVPDPSVPGGHRYYLADYKTNRLDRPTSSGAAGSGVAERAAYGRAGMARAMAAHGYHLQSLLYTVALHRFLAHRLPGYAYDTHMGGHLYLFVRGMEGEASRVFGGARGVYHERWPADVVAGLDRALDGGDAGAAALRAGDTTHGGGLP